MLDVRKSAKIHILPQSLLASSREELVMMGTTVECPVSKASVKPWNSLCTIRGALMTRCRLELRATIDLPGRSTAIVDLSKKLSIMHPES